MNIYENMEKNQKYLSKNACLNKDAIRLKEEQNDIRPAFFRDADRILHSLSYTRYSDKTQVFSNNDNDLISRRMIHVQFVSKIARTIGRALNLNEDLIEAIALGHDIGHVPFGHTGEHILNEISLKNNEGFFMHNIQSVRTFLYLEKFGEGNNLTVQTLDGIMCHNGELLSEKYAPTKKTKIEFLKELSSSYFDKEIAKKLRPMTMEGCVVRISDVIGYIGRDIEDAIMLNKLTKEEIPKEIKDVLGTTNKSIINNIIIDLLENSINKDYLSFSNKTYKALVKLKKFNYEYIYDKANTQSEIEHFKLMFNAVFYNCLDQVNNNKTDSNIYINFLNKMNEKYLLENSNQRIVIDYIAGMTDKYLINEYKKYSL